MIPITNESAGQTSAGRNDKVNINSKTLQPLKLQGLRIFEMI